jgi:hypothetical protein
MKIVPSGLVTDLRGKFGHAVIVLNKQGLYMKPYVYPSKCIDSTNNGIRARMSAIALKWSQLDVAVKNDWVAKALTYYFADNLGRNYHPSGWQLYLYCNMNITIYTSEFIDTPVNSYTVLIPDIISGFTVTEGYSFTLFWNAPLIDQFQVVVKCSKLLPPSSHAFIYPSVNIAYFKGGDTQPYDITTQVQGLIGPNAKIGEKLFMAYSSVDTVTGVSSGLFTEVIQIAS